MLYGYTFEALGLTVSRLIRVRFGIVNLPPSIKRGKMAELGEGEINMILDWVGLVTQPAVELAVDQGVCFAEEKTPAKRHLPLNNGKQSESVKGKQKSTTGVTSRGGRHKT